MDPIQIVFVVAAACPCLPTSSSACLILNNCNRKNHINSLFNATCIAKPDNSTRFTRTRFSPTRSQEIRKHWDAQQSIKPRIPPNTYHILTILRSIVFFFLFYLQKTSVSEICLKAQGLSKTPDKNKNKMNEWWGSWFCISKKKELKSSAWNTLE